MLNIRFAFINKAITNDIAPVLELYGYQIRFFSTNRAMQEYNQEYNKDIWKLDTG